MAFRLCQVISSHSLSFVNKSYQSGAQPKCMLELLKAQKKAKQNQKKIKKELCPRCISYVL